MRQSPRPVQPIHPGEILREEFLVPLELSPLQLARGIGVPARRIREILGETRRISADSALRLGRFFGTTERFWMNLQSHYELEVERERLGPRLEEEVIQFDSSPSRPDSRS